MLWNLSLALENLVLECQLLKETHTVAYNCVIDYITRGTDMFNMDIMYLEDDV